MTPFQKGSGVLLHLTSLPGTFGIGDLGAGAYSFIDFLTAAGHRYWQILPFNPMGYGDSPYQAFSAFAASPLFISPELLIAEGILTKRDVEDCPKFNPSKVEYSLVMNYKYQLYRKAFSRFNRDNQDFNRFKRDNTLWLEEYGLFMALKDYFQGLPWNRWDQGVARREPQELEKYKYVLQKEIEFHKFLQFKFWTQWIALKDCAKRNGVIIIGDVPIFVGYDSSDVWAKPPLFSIDSQGELLKVAGVPPDYFSSTGQLWGNPHYNWKLMQKDDYQWWRARLSHTLSLVDIIRIDHFRGFEAFWEIPAYEDTAINGRWVKGPGADFFLTLEGYLGKLPIIAEDLGIITPEVEELKNRFGYPGMKILQFILEDTSRKLTLPLTLGIDAVAYTGTHDNDTMLGWYKTQSRENAAIWKRLQSNLNLRPEMDEQEVCWRFIEIVLHSDAKLAIIPLQDILALDTSARMNYPGTVGGNWQWRVRKEQLNQELVTKLNVLNKNSNRY